MKPEIKNVPLPMWMQKLPRDERGYPIPYIALIDNDGKPQFTVNEEHKRQKVLNKNLCGICGRKLLRYRALVGGPLSAFFETGAYIDPPMHIECCRYALKVCPYLATPSWTKSLGTKKIKQATLDADRLILVDNTMMPDRPPLFVVAVHTKVDFVRYENSKVIQYIKPRKPYISVEYWRQGERLDDQVGEKEAKEFMVNSLAADFDETLNDIGQSNVQAILQRL